VGSGIKVEEASDPLQGVAAVSNHRFVIQNHQLLREREKGWVGGGGVGDKKKEEAGKVGGKMDVRCGTMKLDS
jgi:hypothetical protein